jgi:uncharacterized RDD family membrane protein YckC
MKKILSLGIDYVAILLMMFLIYVFIGLLVGIMGGPMWVENGEVTEERLEEIVTYVIEFASLIMVFFYYGQPFSRKSKTFGDKILKINILPEGREKIGVWFALIRTMCLAPFFAILGVIPIKGDPTNTLLDKICKTRTEYN